MWRRRGCRARTRKRRNIEIINTHRPARRISQRHLDSWRLPVQLTERCQQSTRPRLTIQVGVDGVSCFYVLNPTSLAKADAFVQLVTDANSIGADIIIVTETWLKTKHPDDAFVIAALSSCERTVTSGRVAVYARLREKSYVQDGLTFKYGKHGSLVVRCDSRRRTYDDRLRVLPSA